MSSWDWLMSLDPHWFSTLYGWYVFTSYFVSAFAVIILFVIYLKRQGYLSYVNDSHFTTCSDSIPHYHFQSNYMKIIPNDRIIAKPVIFQIQDLPIFYLPFKQSVHGRPPHLFYDSRHRAHPHMERKKTPIFVQRWGLMNVMRIWR